MFDAGWSGRRAREDADWGGSILHFDPYLIAGGAWSISALASDLAGNAGLA